jgi:hypothetical protein
LPVLNNRRDQLTIAPIAASKHNRRDPISHPARSRRRSRIR